MNVIRALYITTLWYLLMTGSVILFATSFFFPILYVAAIIYTLAVLLLTVFDFYLLFRPQQTIQAKRSLPPRFSLGDENVVHLDIYNPYPFKAYVTIIDELPEQFQERNFALKLRLGYRTRNNHSYILHPLERGEYQFGNLLCYISSPLRLLRRKENADEPAIVKVYPSYQQLKKHQLLALGSNASSGFRKTRKLGHSLEFDKIKNYVPGDDIRTINWKATARHSELMVNTYSDARQQQVYCLIDKGRSMKMPFEGMTLLDYSINASLALLNMVLLKQDKAGLITFSDKTDDIVVANRKTDQLTRILEALYSQQTDFKESGYEQLWSVVHKKITQRSCILLFTNFETYSALERQLPYLKRIASRHLLCVIFFQNTLLKQIHETTPDTIEGIYIKTIADRFDYEKKQIVKELRRHGILSILSTPESISVDVINKYLELKSRQMA